jgi:hypothetical protein
VVLKGSTDKWRLMLHRKGQARNTVIGGHQLSGKKHMALDRGFLPAKVDVKSTTGTFWCIRTTGSS